MLTVKEQLLDYCDCIKGFKDDNTLDRNIAELISLISIQTCWARHPCETFLNSERVEVIDVPELRRCSCNGGVVEFSPFFFPFNVDSFKVELLRIDGIKETVIEISEDDYAWSYGLNVLRINLIDYIEAEDRCSCPVIFKLRIIYDAGFEGIPDCLLKLFCDMLHLIYLKNECSCDHCEACRGGATDVLIEEQSSGSLSERVSDYLVATLFNSYADQLALISLCGRRVAQDDFFGVIV